MVLINSSPARGAKAAVLVLRKSKVAQSHKQPQCFAEYCGQNAKMVLPVQDLATSAITHFPEQSKLRSGRVMKVRELVKR